MDDFWNFSEILEEKYQEDLRFIKRNQHLMGIPDQEHTHCFGHEIDKYNAGIIRRLIEKALKENEPFDWEELRFALEYHAKVIEHNYRVASINDNA